MATSQQQQEFDDLRQRLKNLQGPVQAFEAAFAAAKKAGKGVNDVLDMMEAHIIKITRGQRSFNDDMRDTLDLARAVADSMERQNAGINRAKRAMAGMISIGQQIVDEERELEGLSERRLQLMARESRLKLKHFQAEAQRLLQGKTLQQKISNNAITLKDLEAKASIQALDRRDKKLKKQLEDEQEILLAYQDEENAFKRIVALTKERYKLEKATSTTFGLTGVALAAASNIASRFGMSHVQDQLDDINNKLREDIRKEIELNDGKALSFGRRFVYAGKAVFELTKTLAKGMTDPLYIMTKIFTAFLDVNKAAVDYTRLSGINATSQAALNSRLATSVDYLQTAAELTKQLGMSATSVFDNDTIAGIAEAKNLLGLTAEQAGSLGIQSKLANQDIDSFQDNLLKGVSAGNQLNHSLVAPGVAMNDILDASEDITMSLGNNPDALGKAAVAARAFGMSLKQVSDIADGLLNFEDSISAELEAELMTGRYLNLERARELALMNDIEGLSKELANNGATAAEFSKMNRLEQNALAKALGMNREQLAKSILAQEASKDATLEEKAAVMGVTKEQMQSMEIQERLTKSFEKLAQAFAPVLQAVVPIVELLASALQPIAMIIGYISSGIGFLLGPLLKVYTLFKGIQLITVGIAAFNKGMVATLALQANTGAVIQGQKATQLLTEAGILNFLFLQDARLAYKMAKEEGITGFKLVQAVLEETILGSLLLQGGAMIKNLVVGGYRLIQAIAIAAAEMMGVSALTLGLGVAGVIAAGIAGVVALKMATADDMVSSPAGYGKRMLTGPEGAIALNDKDTVIAGTRLFDSKQESSQERVNSVPKTTQSTMSAAVRRSDTSNEIKQMRQENRQLLTALLNKSTDIYMSSNKVGTSVVLGAQKSS